MTQPLDGFKVKTRPRFLTISLFVVLGIAAILYVRSELEYYHNKECIATIRKRSDSNPILARLKVPLDSIAQLKLQSLREALGDSTFSADFMFGRILICTSDSLNGIVTFYWRESVATEDVSFGNLDLYRYRIRNGILSIMKLSSSLGMSGNANNPIPQWEEYDENAVHFLRNFEIIDDECNVVDSMLIKPDGYPESMHFHDP